jgi:hypothetical protein
VIPSLACESAASREHDLARILMMRFAALITLALVVAACSPDSEATGSINKCATELFPAFNPKIMDQCVAVCKKCDHGVTTTCTTSCTLKGAR